MQKMIYMLCLAGFVIGQPAMAEAPVTISDPTPSIPSVLLPSSSTTYRYTVTNRVPHTSFPITVEGLSDPITRTTVTNDCGSMLPPGPSTCDIGITIAPTQASHSSINENLSVNYRGRVPLIKNITFSTNPSSFVAGGEYATDDTDSIYPSFATSNNGSSWQQQVILPVTGYTQGYSAGMSCVASTCVSVGVVTNNQSQYFSEIFLTNNSGVSWSQQVLPFSSGISAAGLVGVSCLSGICNAVGQSEVSFDQTGHMGLARSTDSGVTWTQNVLPLTESLLNESLNAVSCSSDNCVAVGSGYDVSDVTYPVIATSANKGLSWTSQKLDLPDGSSDAVLSGVSCNGSQCFAVGNYYANNFGSPKPGLAISTNSGTSWELSTLPLAEGYDYGTLNAIECSVDSCIAVGSTYVDNQYLTNPSILIYHQGEWTAQALDLPVGYNTGELSGIHCVGDHCVATGSYTSNTGYVNFQGIAYSVDHGATWTQQVLTPPENYSGGRLFGVS